MNPHLISGTSRVAPAYWPVSAASPATRNQPPVGSPHKRERMLLLGETGPNPVRSCGADSPAFSGGEIKRSEVLQLMGQSPKFVMLDEPESGVDLENISLIGNAIGKLLEKNVHIVNRKKSGLVITHTGYILDYLDADKGHVMCDGAIKCHGNPREILKEIKARGYRECLECRQI